jgi:hypothetical protein
MKAYLISFLFLLLSTSLSFSQSSGMIDFEITETDAGKLIPARLIILKNGLPHEHNMESNLQLACRGNTIYTANGKGRFTLAPGTYEFWFSRGMEYSVDVKEVKIEAGQNYNLKAKLVRELDTKGLVSGDMHLHTYTNSGHGDATLEERVISCAAEGLEWAVATDHNYLTDYTPYLNSVGLKGVMATTVSNEVSTQIGHFNTYPLDRGTAPADDTIKDGNKLFDHIRALAPKPVVIQINHPRWSSTDFFNIKELDPYFGFSKHKEWSWNFDAIEVLNENYQLGWRIASNNKHSVKKDWFNMLNHNKKICGVGNSDSHTVIANIAGVPRNYIVSSTDIPAEIDEDELSANIKAQKVSVSYGLLPSITVNGSYGMGATVSAKGKSVTLQLKVQAASWVSCNKVELIRNGVVEKTFDIPQSKNAVRFDKVIEVTPEKDSWYLLIAYGDEPMFPMAGEVNKPVKPLGFTNPIWVDANDDGRFTSIYDYSKSRLVDLTAGVKEALKIFKAEPEIIPFSFFILFEKDPVFAIKLTEQYLKHADIEEKLILYRELSKRGSPETTGLLKRQQLQTNSPLEEINLARHIKFPLHKNRVEQFKKKKTDELNEKLSRMESSFSYIQSGAEERLFDVKYLSNTATPSSEAWHKVQTQKDGHIYPGNNPLAKGKQKAIIKTKLYARKNTMVECYIRTNVPLGFSINGKKQKTLLTNAKAPVKDKFIQIPLQKGNNIIEFTTNDLKNAAISFMEISNHLLLDATEEIVEVIHKAKDKEVEYLTPYNDKYHGYNIALTDGLRGNTSWSNQLWQGWDGKNMEVIIDLGEKQKVQKISLGLLADQGSWIFFPEKIQFFSSNNGTDYQQIYETEIDATKKLKNAKIKDFGNSFLYLNARYIKVVATPIEALPEWHSAAGNTGAWIFADEIIVE